MLKSDSFGAPKGRHMEQESNAQSRLILAVDDDDLSRSLLEAVLRRAGYRVLLTADGHSALNVAVQMQPAAIVCDIHLNDMDGFQVAQRLQNHPNTAPIPVILLTGHEAPGDAEAARAAGASALLLKGRSRDTLLQTIAALLAGDADESAPRAG
jgi:CheY-like chemotaxis protein